MLTALSTKTMKEAQVENGAEIGVARGSGHWERTNQLWMKQVAAIS
jgi:hypothetical protein